MIREPPISATILQLESRPDMFFFLLTQEVNQKFCEKNGYTYEFRHLDNTAYGYNLDHKTAKLFALNDFIQNHDSDTILIFLDSDAWVQSHPGLNELLDFIQEKSHIHGCFSREPYLRKNTFVNSGSFMLKINPYTRQMFRTIIQDFANDRANGVIHDWHDQYYISKFVYDHINDFLVFVPTTLNTPCGDILRHNWWKSDKMYTDLLSVILDGGTSPTWGKYDIVANLDTEPFPNPEEEGEEYL